MSLANLGFGRFGRTLCDLLIYDVQDGRAYDSCMALPARPAEASAAEEERVRLLAELELIHQQLIDHASDESLAIPSHRRHRRELSQPA